jgi:fibronectin-binding autotransporter adhesin
MKPRRNLFLGSLLVVASISTHQGRADIFDTNSTTSGFGVTNGGTYDWWTANYWSDGTGATNDAGTAATVTWQGTTSVNEQAFFVGSGTAGQNYTVRLGSTGSTNTYIQNIAINVNAAGSAALTGAAGDVTIGNSGDTGKLIIRASNSVGAQNGGTLTINNGVNLQSFTLNYRGGNTVINGVVEGTGKIVFGSGAFGLSAGTLTLANTANTYSGRTNADYISTGYTLAVTKLANGGSSSSIGTSSANIGINGGTLKYIGNTGAQSTNLGLNIGSANAFLSADGATSSDTISFTGSPTYTAANSARTITLTGANSGGNTMGFVFNDNGTGKNVLIKTGIGRWLVNQANGYTGQTHAREGTLVATNTAAFGATGAIVNVGFNTTVGAVEFATDTTANAYVLNVSSGYTGTVIVNRASSGSTITHTMGTSTIGNGTLNIEKGANVTGDGILEFGGITMSAGATGLSTGTMLNPTTAKVLVSGNVTRTGSLANLLTLDGTSSGNQISGVISGPQALTKSNTSTWILSNANTFSGNTKVTGGSLILKNNLALQSSAFDTSGAGTLDLTDVSITTPTLGGLIGDSGTGQNLVLPSNVTGLTLNPSGTVTYVKNISGGAAGLTLTKSGTGTQILSGTNTYSGLTTINGGELRVTTAGAIGGTNVTVTNGQLALDGGITVSGKSLTTSGSGNNFLGGLQSVTGTNEWAGSVLLGANDSRIGARKNATLVVSGAIGDGAGTYNLVIRSEGAGTNNNGAGNANTVTVLSGANTYGGNTQLINGLTKLDGGDNRLPTSTVLQFGLGNTNAKFDMNGRNQEVAGLAVTSSGTDANRDWNANELTNSSGTLSTLTVNTTADQTFGGTLTNNVGKITGNIALVKDGSAKLTLSGTNSYTGSTTVTAGTLVINGNISTSITTVQNGGTLAGSGTAGSVSVENGGTLAPGTSPGTLTIDGDLGLNDSSILDFELNPLDMTVGGGVNDLVSITGNFTLNGLLNVTPTSGSFAGITSGSWRLFNYSGTLTNNILGFNTMPSLDPGYSWSLDLATSGQVNLTVVPEPGAALLGGLGMLALLRRRR